MAIRHTIASVERIFFTDQRLLTVADLKAEAGSIRPAQSFLRLKPQVLRSGVAFPSLRLDPSMGITARGGSPFTFREVLSGTRHRPNCWAHVGGSAILASWIIVA